MTNPIILNIWTIVVEIFFLIAIFLYIVLTKLYTKEHKKYKINNFQTLKFLKAFLIYSVLYSLLVISSLISLVASSK